jgi:hypothetical protein
MQRGTRAALTVAMAGLLAAGAAGVTLAQTEREAPATGSTHFFLLVPVTPSATPGTHPDGSPAAPGEDESSGDATPDTGATQGRSFILIPIPQGDASALEGDDDATEDPAIPGDGATPGGNNGANPGADEDATEGPTLILVPRPLPQSRPDGILEA